MKGTRERRFFSFAFLFIPLSFTFLENKKENRANKCGVKDERVNEACR